MFSVNLWTRPYMAPHLPPGIQPGGGDTSSYLQNPLASPALMVLASSQDMARTGKDPYGATQHSLNNPTPFAHPLYSQMQGQFFRPGLEPRPLGHSLPGAEKLGLGSSHHSAFSPAKRSRLQSESPPEPQKYALDCTVPRSSLSPARSPQYDQPGRSPALSSRSTPDGSLDEDRFLVERESPDRFDVLSEDSLSRRCPVCGQDLSPDIMEEHLLLELRQLESMARSVDNEAATSSNKENMGTDTRDHRSPHLASSSRYQAYLRIRGNRQARFNVKYGKSMYRRRSDETSTCTRTATCAEENMPVVTRSDSVTDSTPENTPQPAADHQVKVTDVTNVMPQEEDEDVDVGCDEIPDIHSHQHTEQHRNTDIDSCSPKREWVEPHVHSRPSETPSTTSLKPDAPSHSKTCGLCQHPYTNPVASVLCWHVYCEECWLQSLGKQKLCPQCQSVTNSTDLRRVFL